jgi:uncharacterized protein
MTLRDLTARLLVLVTLCGPGAVAAGATDAPRPPDEVFGLFTQGPGQYIGINRFITDAGETVVLFADYQSGVVRRLFQEPEKEDFVMGPASAVRDPVEMRIRFDRDAVGGTTSMTLQPVGARATTAHRVALREKQVTFVSRDATLSGTLILPASAGKHPAIVLLHGSGPLTRYSFGPYPNFFASLGFAVLTFDKRGTGASTGIRLDASTGAASPIPDSFYPEVLVEDALAAFRFLSEQPEIHPRRIGFWGSSEGGMLATQVAARQQAVAFAINSSGFAGPLWETLLYQAGAIPQSAGRTEAEVRAAREFAAFWIDVARTGRNFDVFLARREEARKKGDWMLSYFSGHYTTVEQMTWDWQHILSFDPRPSLARVRCPVLALFGELDPLTDAPVAARSLREALARGGNGDFTFRIFPNGSHSLTELPSKSRMAPGVFDTLRSWLQARIPTRGPDTRY